MKIIKELNKKIDNHETLSDNNKNALKKIVEKHYNDKKNDVGGSFTQHEYSKSNIFEIKKELENLGFDVQSGGGNQTILINK